MLSVPPSFSSLKTEEKLSKYTKDLEIPEIWENMETKNFDWFPVVIGAVGLVKKGNKTTGQQDPRKHASE